jgi:hypothetical protein
MKLITYKPTVTTQKSFPGLLDCKFEHEIKGAKATLDWKGPPIPPQMWQEVLAFFQWTYDTTHSESQVRLFVNTLEQTWSAWAFPQKAQSGMTAHEIGDTADWKAQRAQFPDNEGWVYFGTVHHHCSSGAFQSGTDLANERDQDGLHITIGKMASNRYDMHARFYLGGFEFAPDMSEFWSIGPEAANLVPETVWDLVARHQMCEKAKSTTEFPAQWKANLIEVKTTFPVTITQGASSWSPYTSAGSGSAPRQDYLPLWQRARKALGQIAHETLSEKFTESELVQMIEQLAMQETVVGKLIDACIDWQVTAEQLWDEIPHDENLKPMIASYKYEIDQHKRDSVREQQQLTSMSMIEDNGMYGGME